jgi:iron(III) transport system substrate-binding protein
MDLQIKLAIDGRAMTYASPEIAGLPEWAVFRNQAYGTTLEPFVFAYNTRLLPADAVPQTHADLARLLRERGDLFRGKVTAYNPEQSGLGFLAMTQDEKAYPDFWNIVQGMGANQPNLYTSTGTMVEKIASGEHLLGYDIIGSYVLARMKRDSSLGMVNPKDFTVAFSRIAFIADKAPHPSAGKLFLDYLLSKRGQDIMANQALLHAIRGDVTGEATAAALEKELGTALKPIPVNADLAQWLEATNRQQFFTRWQQSMGRS